MKFFEVLSTQPGTTTTPQAAPAIGAATGAGAGMMAGNQPVTPADKAKQQFSNRQNKTYKASIIYFKEFFSTTNAFIFTFQPLHFH